MNGGVEGDSQGRQQRRRDVDDVVDSKGIDVGVDRKRRKAEGKLRKRQRIESSGGIRPRPRRRDDDDDEKNEKEKTETNNDCNGGNGNWPAAATRSTDRTSDNSRFSPQNSGATGNRRNSYGGGGKSSKSASTSGSGRFGKVMERVPCRNRPRFSTISIAVPGSVVANCQTLELKTQLAGQIARAATIYQVDEIVVYDDKLSSTAKQQYYNRRGGRQQRERETERRGGGGLSEGSNDRNVNNNADTDDHALMARILQYCECPQYLRKHFFPVHPCLRFVGLLPPVDAPHHVRADDVRTKYREGVVLDKTAAVDGAGAGGATSLVNCGIWKKPVL